MLSLIGQYIGYGAETEVEAQSSDAQVCSFGETQEGWTLVDVANAHCGKRSSAACLDEEFHRVPSPSPLESLHSSVTEDMDGTAPVMVPAIRAVAHLTGRRTRCSKNNKKQRVNQSHFTQHRPNQMKRSNQVFCKRSTKVSQKFRQIVHQPRKF